MMVLNPESRKRAITAIASAMNDNSPLSWESSEWVYFVDQANHILDALIAAGFHVAVWRKVEENGKAESKAVFEAMCKASVEHSNPEIVWEELDSEFRNVVCSAMKAAIRAARELGWKMVPEEHTTEMHVAAAPYVFEVDIWKTMFDAAPDILAEGE